jgi:hypothetical protein
VMNLSAEDRARLAALLLGTRTGCAAAPSTGETADRPAGSPDVAERE